MTSVYQRRGKGKRHVQGGDGHGKSRSQTIGGSSVQLLNRVCSFWWRIFGRARKRGRYQADNHAHAVARRGAARRSPNHLRWHEVKPVLEAIGPERRPLFAAAVYTGMRKRELLRLRKADIDWGNGLIFVRSSRDGDTPEGKAADAIPIADELVPYLQSAVRRSSSDFVFPKPGGAKREDNVNLAKILRRALVRAGIVEGYTHKCREGCGFSARHAVGALRQCPTCNTNLWPTANVRETRFHDLRHTTRSLLTMAGANPAAVHRILRHCEPRIVTGAYGHLSPEYLRSEINRLRFESPEITSVLPGPAS